MPNGLGIRIQTNLLLRMPIGKSQPTVKRSRSAFTASAGLYPKIGGSSLDHIAQSDLLVRNKSGQAHSVRRVFALIWGVVAFACLGHALHLLAFAVSRD